jgi:hypothetical protein
MGSPTRELALKVMARENSKTRMRVGSGEVLDLAEMLPADVKINDIVVSLAGQARYNGHYEHANPLAKKPLSIMQHSALVYLLALQEAPKDYALLLHALTHDFHEAYIGDIAFPVKQLLFIEDDKNAAAAAVQIKVWGTARPDLSGLHPIVKRYDIASREIESAMMYPGFKTCDSGVLRWAYDTASRVDIPEFLALFHYVQQSYQQSLTIWFEPMQHTIRKEDIE